MAGDGADAEKKLYERFLAARDGDEEALNDLLDEIRPVILRDVRNRVRSATATEAVAEELTQDALLRVAGGVSGCQARTESQFRAWCRTIARHVVIDWYRRREEEKEKRAPGALAKLLWRREGVQRTSELIEAPDHDAGEVERVLGQLLLEAQEVLSEKTQEVLRRRLLYGEIWRVAGEAVDTSAGGAKRRYQRATERLRREVLNRIQRIPDDELRHQLLRRIGGKMP